MYIKHFIVALTAFCFMACHNDVFSFELLRKNSSQVKKALDLSGENRKELEKVLKYYENQPEHCLNPPNAWT